MSPSPTIRSTGWVHILPPARAHLFDNGTRWWKRNIYGHISGTRTQRLGTDSLRVFTNSVAGATVGDLVGMRSGVGDHQNNVASSSRMTLQDLTILNSPLFGIVEGDPLRLVDWNDQPAGEALVAAVMPLPAYQTSRKSSRQTVADLTAGPY